MAPYVIRRSGALNARRPTGGESHDCACRCALVRQGATVGSLAAAGAAGHGLAFRLQIAALGLPFEPLIDHLRIMRSSSSWDLP